MTQIESAEFPCLYCDTKVNFKLYKTIHGENDEYRKLVFNNEVNVLNCNSCDEISYLPIPLMYVYLGSPNSFVVWYDPIEDAANTISDTKSQFKQQYGLDDMYVTAPQIADWEEFKDTIKAFESGELKAIDRGAEVLAKNLSKNSTGCFIATATFGSPLAYEVIILRNWRDNILLHTYLGKVFVRLYYWFSPSLADYINKSEMFKSVSLIILRPLINTLKKRYGKYQNEENRFNV